MSSNGRHKQIHFNSLRPSNEGEVSLGKEVHKRFKELLNSWMRIKGESPHIPISLSEDICRWRIMVMRHRRGDLRNSEAELRSTQAVADWTVEMNCILRNQPIIRVPWAN